MEAPCGQVRESLWFKVPVARQHPQRGASGGLAAGTAPPAPTRHGKIRREKRQRTFCCCSSRKAATILSDRILGALWHRVLHFYSPNHFSIGLGSLRCTGDGGGQREMNGITSPSKVSPSTWGTAQTHAESVTKVPRQWAGSGMTLRPVSIQYLSG